MTAPRPPTVLDRSSFNAGERALQTRVGVRDQMEQLGQRILRDAMPDQHRALFEALPMILMGTLDGDRRPWASARFGAPGFVRSPDPRALTIDAPPMFGDPAAETFAPGAAIGVLGIQLETRRRNRMNGAITEATGARVAIAVDQSFGNCPKYIYARAPSFRRLAGAPREVTTEGPTLSARARAIVTRADAFFLASASREARGGSFAEGVDVSHRGGPPGFVTVADTPSGTELEWPEYQGNDLFNTLGNLLTWPHAGLLFLDFDGGDALSITCDVETRWSAIPAHGASPAAERAVSARVVRGALIRDVLPLAWTAASAPREFRR